MDLRDFLHIHLQRQLNTRSALPLHYPRHNMYLDHATTTTISWIHGMAPLRWDFQCAFTSDHYQACLPPCKRWQGLIVSQSQTLLEEDSRSINKDGDTRQSCQLCCATMEKWSPQRPQASASVLGKYNPIIMLGAS